MFFLYKRAIFLSTLTFFITTCKSYKGGNSNTKNQIFLPIAARAPGPAPTCSTHLDCEDDKICKFGALSSFGMCLDDYGVRDWSEVPVKTPTPLSFPNQNSLPNYRDEIEAAEALRNQFFAEIQLGLNKVILKSRQDVDELEAIARRQNFTYIDEAGQERSVHFSHDNQRRIRELIHQLYQQKLWAHSRISEISSYFGIQTYVRKLSSNLDPSINHSEEAIQQSLEQQYTLIAAPEISEVSNYSIDGDSLEYEISAEAFSAKNNGGSYNRINPQLHDITGPLNAAFMYRSANTDSPSTGLAACASAWYPQPNQITPGTFTYQCLDLSLSFLAWYEHHFLGENNLDDPQFQYAVQYTQKLKEIANELIATGGRDTAIAKWYRYRSFANDVLSLSIPIANHLKMIVQSDPITDVPGKRVVSDIAGILLCTLIAQPLGHFAGQQDISDEEFFGSRACDPLQRSINKMREWQNEMEAKFAQPNNFDTNNSEDRLNLAFAAVTSQANLSSEEIQHASNSALGDLDQNTVLNNAANGACLLSSVATGVTGFFMGGVPALLGVASGSICLIAFASDIERFNYAREMYRITQSSNLFGPRNNYIGHDYIQDRWANVRNRGMLGGLSLIGGVGDAMFVIGATHRSLQLAQRVARMPQGALADVGVTHLSHYTEFDKLVQILQSKRLKPQVHMESERKQLFMGLIHRDQHYQEIKEFFGFGFDDYGNKIYHWEDDVYDYVWIMLDLEHLNYADFYASFQRSFGTGTQWGAPNIEEFASKLDFGSHNPELMLHNEVFPSANGYFQIWVHPRKRDRLIQLLRDNNVDSFLGRPIEDWIKGRERIEF